MDIDISADFVGALCLALTVIFALIAWHLAVQGLGAEAGGGGADGDTLQENLENARTAVANAKLSVEEARDPATVEGLDAAASETQIGQRLNNAEAQLAEAQTSLGSISPGDVLSPIQDALAALTGRQAPTRAFLALALVTFIFSMVAFGVIDFSVVSSQGDDTTTTTTTTATTP